MSSTRTSPTPVPTASRTQTETLADVLGEPDELTCRRLLALLTGGGESIAA